MQVYQQQPYDAYGNKTSNEKRPIETISLLEYNKKLLWEYLIYTHKPDVLFVCKANVCSNYNTLELSFNIRL